MAYRERQIAEDRARTEIAASVAAAALGAARAEVMGGGRTHRVVLARRVAMYLLHVGCGLSLGRVSAAFGRDRATVSYAVQALALRRDEPPFDAWLQALEDAERETNSRGLTMIWDAGPADGERRGSRRGGQSAAAASATARLKRVRGLAGETSWRLAWLACIEGATLKSIKAKMGLGQRTLGPALAHTFEDIANAYER